MDDVPRGRGRKTYSPTLNFMKTYTDLQNAICAFMHRPAGEFVVGGFDVLLRATNNAKDFCQRAIKFNRAFVTTEVVGSASGYVNVNKGILYGGTEMVALRSVDRASTVDVATGAAWPVDIYSYEAWHDEVQRFRDMGVTLPERSSSVLVLEGEQAFVYPYPSGEYRVRLHGARWLPDIEKKVFVGVATSSSTNQVVMSSATFATLGVRIGDVVTVGLKSALVVAVAETTLTLTAHICSSGDTFTVWYLNGAQTNFLIDNCFDFLMYRSIFELNFFLKEDERVVISDSVLQQTWQNVVAWNETVVRNSTTDAKLN